MLGLDGLAGSQLTQLSGSGLAGGLLARFVNQSSLAGVSFAIIDSREEAGRRIQRVLFPDIAPEKAQLFQDFGATDSPLRITGVIVGDDYVIRSKRMRDALLKGGRVTLVHPWWGRLKVRVTRPAEFRFHHAQIRCTAFSVEVTRDPDPPAKKGLFGRITDTINNVLEKADALMDEAQDVIGEALSVVSLPLSIISGVRSLVSQCEGIWDSITESAPEPVKSTVASAIADNHAVSASNGGNASGGSDSGSAGIGTAGAVQAVNRNYAELVVDALASLPAALTAAITEPDQSVIALPSQATISQDEVVTGQTVANLLLQGARETAQRATSIASALPEPGVILVTGIAAQAFVVSQLATAWSASEFTSNQEAEVARDQLIVAIDGLGQSIEQAASARVSQSLRGIYTAAQSFRASIIADANTRIGSLPQVLDVPVAARSSLWSLCYAIGGDNVSDVQRMFDDAVKRNAIRHPALTPAGTVEMLEMKNGD